MSNGMTLQSTVSIKLLIIIIIIIIIITNARGLKI